MTRSDSRPARPDWWWESRAAASGYRCVAGVDEVGRGCLAGPVVAAAVVLADGLDLSGLRDSKQLGERARELWARRLRRQARAWAVGEAVSEEVDRLNVLEATRLAMGRAVRALPEAPDLLLIDAVALGSLDLPQESLVRGDERSVSIAAASVIAKVHRDRFMRLVSSRYPRYAFSKNKGYGTFEHRRALREFGPCRLHRRSFHGVSAT
ncbi:MAG: ribonuclease HII [Acidobacteriota bacterium]